MTPLGSYGIKHEGGFKTLLCARFVAKYIKNELPNMPQTIWLQATATRPDNYRPDNYELGSWERVASGIRTPPCWGPIIWVGRRSDTYAVHAETQRKLNEHFGSTSEIFVRLRSTWPK